jgi:arginyl-tRNA synthetase
MDKKNILVDFSSPNIAKDMHVGHLRSTIIGDSICKLHEIFGHNVLRINHIGDFGLQFGMIIQHLLEKYPNYKESNLSITDLQNLYAESKKRFDVDADFKKEAYQKVVQLQLNINNDIVSAWNFIKDISRLSYNDIYDRLGVKLEEYGESFYQDKIPDVIQELGLKGMLVDDNNRKIIKLDKFELPLTVVKSDGGYTYDTTDLAAVKYRLVDLNMDKVIYVVDEGQTLHFELIFEVAKIMGWKRDDQELVHVGFGLVLDDTGKKFQSRKGDTIKLKDLLDKSLVVAGNVYDKVRKDDNGIGEDERKLIIKNVAYGSIKYADLASMRTTTYKFSLEKMVSLKGNTGVYNLYEYVRICAIVRKAGDFINDLDPRGVSIEDKEEANVCKQILLFPEIIERAYSTLMFHIVCAYMYDLTTAFSSFYKKYKCLVFDSEKNVIGINNNKMLICVSTKKILETCFFVLGINTLDRM